MILNEKEVALMRRLYATAGNKRATRRILHKLVPSSTVSYGNLKMFLNPADNYTDSIVWLTGDSPEPKSIAALQSKIAGKRALIIDIGANSGTYALRLASALGRGGIVRAFEPNPQMFQRLLHNISINSLGSTISAKCQAVGAHHSTAVLNLHPQNLGQTSINKLDVQNLTQVTVPVVPLAEQLADSSDFEYTAMKIDVEGYEAYVFEDFEKLVATQNRPNLILIETAHGENWHYDLVGMLKKIGYKNIFEGEQNTLFELIK